MSSRRVLGVDGVKAKWVAVELVDGVFGRALVVDRLADLQAVPADRIAVDVPIGLEQSGYRKADVGAKRLLIGKASSVFHTPPRPVLNETTWEPALQRARELMGGVGISRQAFALFPKILEAEAAQHADPRIFEVHPELSFRELVGHPMKYPKRSWNGLQERRCALAEAGIELPPTLEGTAGLVPPDDLLDAAIAAWTADRAARGEARPIPDEPETNIGAPGYIWV